MISNYEAAKQLAQAYGVPVNEPVTYREKREADKRRRYKRELGQFVQEAVKWLTVYRGLLCEAVRERNEHFWEGLGNLTYVEYLLGCLKDCPEEVYADKKVVKEIGKVEDELLAGISKLSGLDPFPDEIFYQIFEIEDNVERTQYVEALRKEAGKLKRRPEFNNLYRAFVLDYSQRQKQTGKVTRFTDQP